MLQNALCWPRGKKNWFAEATEDWDRQARQSRSGPERK